MNIKKHKRYRARIKIAAVHLVDFTKAYLDNKKKMDKNYSDAVAILDSRNRHAVSDMVDPFWHTHVLFTKEYSQFSNDVFKKYMHHEPLDHEDVERVDFVEGVYNYTLDVYDKVFRVWDRNMNPRVDTDRICCVMGSGISTDAVLYGQGLFPVNDFMQFA